MESNKNSSREHKSQEQLAHPSDAAENHVETLASADDLEKGTVSKQPQIKEDPNERRQFLVKWDDDDPVSC